MENENLKLVISNIIGEDINGFSRVTVNTDLFNAIKGFNPTILYTEMNDKDTKERIRVFNIEGIDLYASYDQDTRKTMYIMNTTEAKKHHIPLSQQLANGPVTPFNLSDFDRTVISAKDRTETKQLTPTA